MRIDRLNMLADWLNNNHIDFDFSNFITNFDYDNNCGTTCCAIGWLPAIDPENWSWAFFEDDEENKVLDKVCSYFEIEEDMAFHLFYPNKQDTFRFSGTTLYNSSSKELVIYNIKEFIKHVA